MTSGAMRSWLLAASLGALACGHQAAGQGDRPPAIAIENDVTVRFSEPLERFPFDPRELRLREASRQLAKLAGHPVAFDIDVALLPQHEASFHEALIDAIQTLARDLDDLHGCPCRVYMPRSIAIRYDLTAHGGGSVYNAVYDRETAALTIPAYPEEDLVADHLLRAVLEDLHADDMVARYAGKEPAAIPPAEHRDYFEYLRKGWYDLQTSKRRGETGPDEVRKLVGLYEDTRDEALRKDIRERLLPVARDGFTHYYWGHEKLHAQAYPPAIAAYGGFLARHAATLSFAERHTVAQTLYVVNRDVGPVPSPPGFDGFAFALRIIDEWLASTEGPSASEPRLRDAEAKERRAMIGLVACPYVPHSSDPHCRDHVFYDWAFGTPEGRERLAQALRERDSLALTRATFDALMMARDHDAYRTLWRMLEDDAEAWAIATRVLGDDHVIGGHAPWVADELERLWRERPEQRGVLLYLLARSDADGREDAIWGRRFARRFGARPSARDFEAFLDASPLAMRSLGGVLKVIDASPVPAVVARLDAHLDEEHERGDGGYDPIPVLTRHLCDEGTPAERAAMHAYLSRRLRDHASERPVLRNDLDIMAPGGCR